MNTSDDAPFGAPRSRRKSGLDYQYGGGECACFTQSGTATKIQKRGQSDRTRVWPLLEVTADIAPMERRGRFNDADNSAAAQAALHRLIQ